MTTATKEKPTATDAAVLNRDKRERGLKAAEDRVESVNSENAAVNAEWHAAVERGASTEKLRRRVADMDLQMAEARHLVGLAKDNLQAAHEAVAVAQEAGRRIEIEKVIAERFKEDAEIDTAKRNLAKHTGRWMQLADKLSALTAGRSDMPSDDIVRGRRLYDFLTAGLKRHFPRQCDAVIQLEGVSLEQREREMFAPWVGKHGQPSS